MLGNWFLDEDGEDYTFDERSSLYLRSKSHSGAFLRNANEPGHFIPLDLYFAFFILHCVPHFSPPRLSISPPARALSASYGGVMDGGAESKAGLELSGTISLETILLFLLLCTL